MSRDERYKMSGMIRVFMKWPVFIPVAIMLFWVAACSQNRDISETGDKFIELGDIHRQEGDYYEALDNYLSASELEPDSPEIYYRIGLVYGALHSQEGADQSLIRGKRNRLDRRLYREDSHYNNAVYYFRKAADMGHQPSREILRAMYDNIQHRDVKY